uniref:Putative carnitine o-acyltransferase crot n=1 Tax=Ixodes ricinus TaxID=34613 RepID=A0A0K8RJW2_IXORI
MKTPVKMRSRGPLPEPEHLEFHLNDDLLNEIDLAKAEYLRLCDNIDILCEVFTGYGKGFMKQVRVHPEAYLQLALQLAYYRLHNKPAPYVTTNGRSTREFLPRANGNMPVMYVRDDGLCEVNG